MIQNKQKLVYLGEALTVGKDFVRFGYLLELLLGVLLVAAILIRMPDPCQFHVTKI